MDDPGGITASPGDPVCKESTVETRISTSAILCRRMPIYRPAILVEDIFARIVAYYFTVALGHRLVSCQMDQSPLSAEPVRTSYLQITEEYVQYMFMCRGRQYVPSPTMAAAFFRCWETLVE